MKLKVYHGNILHLIFSSQKEMTVTMFRPQEYYECGSKQVRNKTFTFEDFLDFYAEEDGAVDYFEKVQGFNIPSDSLEDFFHKFDLSRREKKLYKITRKFISKPYYVLATKEGDATTLDHELAHAQYYLNSEYRIQAQSLIRNMRADLRRQIMQCLKDKGYDKSVIDDEINAFMSTSGLKYLRQNVKLNVNKIDITPFEDLAKVYISL